MRGADREMLKGHSLKAQHRNKPKGCLSLTNHQVFIGRMLRKPFSQTTNKMKLTHEHIGEPLPDKWCKLIKDYTVEDDRTEARNMVTPAMSIHTLNSLLTQKRAITLKNRAVLNALTQVARSRKAITVYH